MAMLSPEQTNAANNPIFCAGSHIVRVTANAVPGTAESIENAITALRPQTALGSHSIARVLLANPAGGASVWLRTVAQLAAADAGQGIEVQAGEHFEIPWGPGNGLLMETDHNVYLCCYRNNV